MNLPVKLLQSVTKGFIVEFSTNQGNLVNIGVAKVDPADGVRFSATLTVHAVDFTTEGFIEKIVTTAIDDLDETMYKRSVKNPNTCQHREIENMGRIACIDCLGKFGVIETKNLNAMTINIRNQ